jgi:hypothetical protein
MPGVVLPVPGVVLPLPGFVLESDCAATALEGLDVALDAFFATTPTVPRIGPVRGCLAKTGFG